MAELIALEWDASEVRLAVAKTYGSSIHVERLDSVALGSAEDPTERLQEAIASLVGDLGSTGEVLVNIHRGDTELRLMELPSIPVDELAEVVHMQAVRHFTALNDEWTIDFLPLDGKDENETTQRVLAAALDPEVLRGINENCHPAGVSPRRMAIRSFSGASAWVRRDRMSPTSLLVDLLDQEVDLTVVHQRQAVLSRNARLPRLNPPGSQASEATDNPGVADDEMVMGGDSQSPQGTINVSLLQGEIRRTIVAANNQLSGDHVEKIVLLGSDSQLAEQLADGLDLSVELYDCLDQFDYSGTAPNHPERFTALLGLLADEAAGQPPALDFLNPRQPPRVATRGEKTVRYGLLSFVGLAVVTVLVGSLYYVKSGAVSEKVAESVDLDKQITDAATIGAKRKLIETFVDTNVVWLDEISLLSDHFPSSDDAIVRNMHLSNPTGAGGRISMDVNVSAAEKVGPMENELRRYFAAVRSDGIKPDEDDPNYKTRFKQTVDVLPRKFKPKPESETDEAAAEEAAEEAVGSDASAQTGTAQGRELN